VRTKPRNRVRFVWWGAEELGLLGSRHYVERLSSTERRRHALYLNFDMVGSPNFVALVYDGSEAPAGSTAIQRVLTRYFDARKIPYGLTEMGGGSDHASFARAGIPIGGIFTGADGRKTEAERAQFGGRAGQPYDPCYHQACDTVRNIHRGALTRMARAATHAITVFSRNVSAVRRGS
jgi:Zn-dependent M28 family amino/carboxypeptidase